MAHLDAILVLYDTPYKTAKTKQPPAAPQQQGVIDMSRNWWHPDPDVRTSVANTLVELYAPGWVLPLYRSPPHLGTPEEQVRAAVCQYIAFGVYAETGRSHPHGLDADTIKLLSDCATLQSVAALGTMFDIERAGGLFHVLLHDRKRIELQAATARQAEYSRAHCVGSRRRS